MPPSQTARKLVQAFTTISSTEDLIIFVAGTDAMLSFCRELIEQYDSDAPAFMTVEVNTLCAEKGVLPGMLYAEVRKVLLALNKFHDATQDHYAVLGLKEGASTGEIKKAYRTLSKQYHPDMMNEAEDTTKQFMKISGAYHAIMANSNGQKTDKQTVWRKKGKDHSTRRHIGRKKFLVTVAGLIGVLAGISIILSIRYDEQISHSQEQSWAVQTKSKTPQGKQRRIDVKQPLPESTEPALHETKDNMTSQEDIAVAEQPPLQTTKLEQQQPRSEKPVQQEVAIPPTIPPVELSVVPPVSAPDVTPPVTSPREIQTVADLPPEPSNSGGQPTPPEEKNRTASLENKAPLQTVQAPVHTEGIHIPPENTAKKTREKKPEPIDQTVAINNVLDRYTELYNRREIPAFLALFTENATENGQLQSSLIDQYESLFTHTEAIELDLADIVWKKFQEGFKATGTFTTKYSYKDGETREYIGSIVFYLTEEQDGLKIQSLDYVFVN